MEGRERKTVREVEMERRGRGEGQVDKEREESEREASNKLTDSYVPHSLKN